MSNQIITVTQHGEFTKTQKFLERCKNIVKLGNLDKYGRMGVEALRAATPVYTGLAASSWTYRISHDGDTTTLEWHNTDVENGFNVIIGVQYGHATKSGSWVQGVDFINPALAPVFEQIRQDVWKEVTKH